MMIAILESLGAGLSAISDPPALLILDAHQEQSCCRCSGSGRRAILCCEDLRDRFNCDAALTDEQKASYKVADHVVQESITAHAIGEELAFALP